ncbi:HmuY family protein [Capnocytophaga sp. ARDL2]|uniref:HmuY family protein n=1 Tax=Capnocytophaga sp. ARDL2 TaxID=3238809 RepID=UPI0035592881
MKNYIILSSLIATTIISCKSDDNSVKNNIAVSFENPSVNANQETTEVKILFSKPTSDAGVLHLTLTETNAVYGTDYTTAPSANNQSLQVPFQAGVQSVSFQFVRQNASNTGSVKVAIQSIASNGIYQVQGNTSTQISLSESSSLGGVIAPEVGGSTQPNRVYIDLSDNSQKGYRRDQWDLGFYSGNEYRVILNNSMKMAVKQLNTNDITQMVSIDEAVAVGTFLESNMAFVDHPNGAISQTAIAEISANADENKVYLLNLGNAIPTTPASAGAVNVAGDARGWRKIKINRAANGYQLLYAELGSTTYQEVSIPKNTTHNFSFFSLQNNQIVTAEPEKTKWDLCFSTFTNEVEGFGSYFFSDVILSNHKNGVVAYQVKEENGVSYNSFTASQIEQSKFQTSEAKDQRAIGASWRNTQPLELYLDVFYVVKDVQGAVYKLKITQMQNSTNERGYPKVQYSKL